MSMRMIGLANELYGRKKGAVRLVLIGCLAAGASRTRSAQVCAEGASQGDEEAGSYLLGKPLTYLC